MGSSTKERPRPTGPSLPSCPRSALPRMIASSSSASTATWFSASFATLAPEPPYSHNCAGYSSRGLRRTMVLLAFIVVLLIGASYRGDPSADGPAKRSAQTISFAPSAGPGDIDKLTSTIKAGIFVGIDGLSLEMLDEMTHTRIRTRTSSTRSQRSPHLPALQAIRLLLAVRSPSPCFTPSRRLKTMGGRDCGHEVATCAVARRFRRHREVEGA
jgi:hypothetical protein